MTGKIHDFEPKIGNGYEISLFHIDHKMKEKHRGTKIVFRQNLLNLNLTNELFKPLISNQTKTSFRGE